MNEKSRNAMYSLICVIAVAIAIAGVYVPHIHFIQIAALLVVACIIDSWRYETS